MEGLEQLLRGVPEEWTQVKRAAREAGEERERLKRKAEALVLAQELGEEQREAAVVSLSVHVYLHKCVYMYAVTEKRHAAMRPPTFVPRSLWLGHTRRLSSRMLVWLLRPRIQGPWAGRYMTSCLSYKERHESYVRVCEKQDSFMLNAATISNC